MADSLRASIRNGRYHSGERLIELAIAQSQNVSQNTVRDALRQLESEGWVRYVPRRGVRVREFDADEAEEIFTLMGTIEAVALGWLFEDFSRADIITALMPPIAQARAAHERDDSTGLREAIFAFHAALSTLPDRQQSRAILAVLHNQAYLLTVDYDFQHAHLPRTDEQVGGYEHLIGVIKFGTPREAQDALSARIHADSRPIVRWLALHG